MLSGFKRVLPAKASKSSDKIILRDIVDLAQNGEVGNEKELPGEADGFLMQRKAVIGMELQ